MRVVVLVLGLWSCAALVAAAATKRTPLQRMLERHAQHRALQHQQQHLTPTDPHGVASAFVDADAHLHAHAHAQVALPANYHYPMMAGEPNPPAWSVPATAQCRAAANTVRALLEPLMGDVQHTMVGVMVTTPTVAGGGGAPTLHIAMSSEVASAAFARANLASPAKIDVAFGAVHLYDSANQKRDIPMNFAAAVPDFAKFADAAAPHEPCKPRIRWDIREYKAHGDEPPRPSETVGAFIESPCGVNERKLMDARPLARALALVAPLTAALKVSEDTYQAVRVAEAKTELDGMTAAAMAQAVEEKELELNRQKCIKDTEASLRKLGKAQSAAKKGKAGGAASASAAEKKPKISEADLRKLAAKSFGNDLNAARAAYYAPPVEVKVDSEADLQRALQQFKDGAAACRLEAQATYDTTVQALRDARQTAMDAAEAARKLARGAAYDRAFTGAAAGAFAGAVNPAGYTPALIAGLRTTVVDMAQDPAGYEQFIERVMNEASARKVEENPGNPYGQCAGSKLAFMASTLRVAHHTINCITEVYATKTGVGRGTVKVRAYADGAGNDAVSSWGEAAAGGGGATEGVPSCATCRMVMGHWLTHRPA